jgi:hypothetical protein
MNDTSLVPYLDYDLDTAKEETAAQQSAAENESQTFFKAKDGENILRVIPPPMSWLEWFKLRGKKPSPFFLFFKHFYDQASVGAGEGWVSLACPHRNAKEGALFHGDEWADYPCPHCIESKRLRDTGDSLDDDLGFEISARHKCLVNVIDRNNEAAGPLVWEVSAPTGRWKGKTMYERVRALMEGRTARNVVTPTAAGFDIVLTKTGRGRRGTSYRVEADVNPSPLHADPDTALRWINGQHDLRRFIIPPTREQMVTLAGGDSSTGRVEQPVRGRPAIEAQQTAQDVIDAEVVTDDDKLEF